MTAADRSRALAHGGMLAALLTAGILIVNVLPSGQLAGLCLLSLLPGVELRRGYRGTVALACLASVILAGVLGLQPGIFCLYAAFFAWYALLWTATEGKSAGRWLRYLASQGSILLAAGLWRLLGGAWMGLIPQVLAAEVAVVAFDFAFGLCVKFYDERISRK